MKSTRATQCYKELHSAAASELSQLAGHFEAEDLPAAIRRLCNLHNNHEHRVPKGRRREALRTHDQELMDIIATVVARFYPGAELISAVHHIQRKGPTGTRTIAANFTATAPAAQWLPGTPGQTGTTRENPVQGNLSETYQNSLDQPDQRRSDELQEQVNELKKDMEEMRRDQTQLRQDVVKESQQIRAEMRTNHQYTLRQLEATQTQLTSLLHDALARILPQHLRRTAEYPTVKQKTRRPTGGARSPSPGRSSI